MSINPFLLFFWIYFRIYKKFFFSLDNTDNIYNVPLHPNNLLLGLGENNKILNLYIWSKLIFIKISWNLNKLMNFFQNCFLLNKIGIFLSTVTPKNVLLSPGRTFYCVEIGKRGYIIYGLWLKNVDLKVSMNLLDKRIINI